MIQRPNNARRKIIQRMIQTVEIRFTIEQAKLQLLENRHRKLKPMHLKNSDRKNNAPYVAKVFNHVDGLDYFDTFTPTSKPEPF